MSKKITRDLGPVHAYALAVAEGFDGTKSEWETYIAQAAENAENAAASAEEAAESRMQARQYMNAASRSAESAQEWAGATEELIDETAEALDRNSQTMAIWARNIGEMEAKMDDVDRANEYYEEIRHTLDTTDLAKRINRPNLLKQNFTTMRDVPTSAVVVKTISIPAEDATQAADPYTVTVTDEGIAANFGKYWVVSRDYSIVHPNNVTVQCTAGQAVITISSRGAHAEAFSIQVQLCTWANQEVPYGDVYRAYASQGGYIDSIGNASITGQDPDDITVSVLNLTGTDIIEEADGERYTNALRFTVNQANTAWGNLERLIFNYGGYGAGKVGQKDYGNLPMEAGKRYTMSCWVRVASGTQMYIAMGWDAHKDRYNNEHKKYFHIEGGTWQRVSFEFIFNPAGDQFYTYESEGNTYQGYNWTKTVYFGCSRLYAGAIDMCGFRLTAGRLNINQTYDELMDRIEELEGRINELEAMTLENQGS